MAAVVGSLYARLQADASGLDAGLTLAGQRIQKFEKSSIARFNAFDKSTNGAFRSVAFGAERLAGRLSLTNRAAALGGAGFSTLARTAALSLAPILSFGAAIAGAKSALADFDKIGKSAKAAGLGAEDFQAFAVAANLGGVAFDEFAKALQMFAKNTGLAAVGQGRLITQLKALDPELLKSLQHTSSQADRLRIVADALQQQTDASKRAAIASALFGEQGARMVEVLKGGAAALDATAQRARAMGLIVSNDLIAQAEAMNDKFSLATQVLDLQFKRVLIQLAPVLTGTVTAISGLVGAVEDLWSAIAKSPGVQHLSAITAPLDQRSLAIMKDQLAQKKAVLSGGGWLFDRAGVEREVANLEAAIKARTDPSKFNLGGSFSALTGTQTFGSVSEMWASMRGTGSTGSTAPASGDAAATAAIKQAQSVVDALKFQREQLGRNADAQELYNQLKAAGVDLDSQFGQAIAQNVAALQDERKAQEQAAQAIALAQSAANTFISTLADDLKSGRSFWESFADAGIKAIDSVVQHWLQSAIANLVTGALSGAGGSFLGGIFGFANGGVAAHGRPLALPRYAGGGISRSAAIFGEAGPEAAVPLPDGRRIPVQLSVRPSLPARFTPAANTNDLAAPVGITINTTIDARGSAMSEGQFAAVLEKHDKSLEKRLPGMIRKAQLKRQL